MSVLNVAGHFLYATVRMLKFSLVALLLFGASVFASALSPHSAPHPNLQTTITFDTAQLSLAGTAEQPKTNDLASTSNNIEFVVGFYLAPYVLRNSKGLVGEIITQALKEKGYTATFNFMTNSEALEFYENGGADAVAVVKEGMSSGFLSRPVVTFNNLAISLSKNHFNVNSIEDLSAHSVAGFSNAKSFLGEDFYSMTQKNPQYQEIANQKEQVKALFQGEVDFIVADETIFRFNQNTLTHEFTFDGKYRQKVNTYRLFNPVPYYVSFANEAHMEIFNSGLEAVIKNGKVSKLYQKYTELLQKY